MYGLIIKKKWLDLIVSGKKVIGPMVMERNNSNKKKRRNRTIQTQKYKEEKIAVKKEMQHFEACNW